MPDTLPPRIKPSRFKLAALSALGVAMVALPLYQVLRYQSAELQAAVAEQAGLDPVLRSVAVQHSLLAHRDVAGHVLRGQTALEPERLSRQGEVDARVAQLAGALVVVATERAFEESNALREDWALLARQIQQRQIDAPESDLGHRLLVEQTLQLIDLVADASGLGRDRDAGAAVLASTMTRSLPRLAAEIAVLSPSGVSDRHADERQIAATETALARGLGRLNRAIEGSAVPQPILAAATAEAGAAADRFFSLLRQQPAADASSAGQHALQAQFRLLDATRNAMAETLSARVAQARLARDLMVASMAVLALLAAALARQLLVPPGGPASAAASRPRQDETDLPAFGMPNERRRAGPRASTSREETGRLLQRLRPTPGSGTVAGEHGSHVDTLPPERP